MQNPLLDLCGFPLRSRQNPGLVSEMQPLTHPCKSRTFCQARDGASLSASDHKGMTDNQLEKPMALRLSSGRIAKELWGGKSFLHET